MQFCWDLNQEPSYSEATLLITPVLPLLCYIYTNNEIIIYNIDKLLDHIKSHKSCRIATLKNLEADKKTASR